jgi:hypothetical protein
MFWVVTDNLNMMNCKMQLAAEACAQFERGARILPDWHPGAWSRGCKAAILRRRSPENDVSLQAADFSPVRTIFDVFRPISQPQGFDFSPVTKKQPEKFSGSENKMRDSKPSTKLFRSAEAAADEKYAPVGGQNPHDKTQ